MRTLAGGSTVRAGREKRQVQRGRVQRPGEDAESTESIHSAGID